MGNFARCALWMDTQALFLHWHSAPMDVLWLVAATILPIKVWDLSNGLLVQTVDQGNIVHFTILSEDDSLLISGCDDGTVKIWMRNWKYLESK